MTWYTLDPPSSPWTEASTVSTSWRSPDGLLSDWDTSRGGTGLYDVTGEALYGLGGETLEAADE